MIHYRSILPPLVAAAAVALFARLGIWQLHRADEAEALRAAMAANERAPPRLLDAAALGGGLEALRWHAVELHGAWQRHQILLDNQVSRGVAGYLVYTPLRVPGCGCALLVNRGWVAAGPRRDVVPDVGLTATRAAVRGILAPAPAPGFGERPGPGEPLGAGLLRVQTFDAARLSRLLGERVLPLTVLLAPGEPGGYRREWRTPGMPPARHLAYAGQWFLFALITAGLAIRMNSSRSRESKRDASSDKE